MPERPSSPGPIRIHEPAGATCVVAPDGVTLDGERVPPEWAREVRRLFVGPAPEEETDAGERPALRLLAPDPADAAVLGPPAHLRWSAVPGVGRYLITLEVLTDPAEQMWHPVRDLVSIEVRGTQFSLPAEVTWVPGMLYRWRVESADGRAVAAGRFRLLSAAQRERLLAARQAAGKSRLLRAAIDRSFGLYGEALADLRSLRAARPEDAALWRATKSLEADVRRQWAAGAG